MYAGGMMRVQKPEGAFLAQLLELARLCGWRRAASAAIAGSPADAVQKKNRRFRVVGRLLGEGPRQLVREAPAMMDSSKSPVRRLVRKVAQTCCDVGVAEWQLLQRFLALGDQRAFEVLVRQHGPMVLRMCLRILPNRQDAEDAFQATFLVLAKKAAALRAEGSVAAWLHGVAYRVAHKARVAAARRRKHERCCKERNDEDPLSDLTLREAHDVLHQELLRLPDKLRVPLVLCYLEGLTRDEAARRLGCSASLVKSRLEQGRDRLHLRLVRRGLALSGTLITVLFDETTVGAAVPAVLATSTTNAALAAAAWSTAVVPARAAAIAERTLHEMLAAKVKSVFALSIVAALFLVPVALVTVTAFGAAAQDDAVKATARAEPVQSSPPTPAQTARQGQEKPAGDRDKLQGTWRIVEFVVDGQPAQKQNPTEEANMVVKGDQIWMVALPADKKVKEFRFKIDPAKKPKTIDLSVRTDKAKEEIAHGIYELEGDRWRLCMPQDANEAKDRPTSIKSEAGSRLAVMTLKRLSAPKKQ
jgi:RNA polymerase sigma factor (sigma-70 family)